MTLCKGADGLPSYVQPPQRCRVAGMCRAAHACSCRGDVRNGNLNRRCELGTDRQAKGLTVWDISFCWMIFGLTGMAAFQYLAPAYGWYAGKGVLFFAVIVLGSSLLYREHVEFQLSRCRLPEKDGYSAASSGLFYHPPLADFGRYSSVGLARREWFCLLLFPVMAVLPVAVDILGPAHSSPQVFVLLVNSSLVGVSFLPLPALARLDRGASHSAAIFGKMMGVVLVAVDLGLLIAFGSDISTWAQFVNQPFELLPAAAGSLCAIATTASAIVCAISVNREAAISLDRIPFYRRLCRWIIWAGSLSIYSSGLAFVALTPSIDRLGTFRQLAEAAGLEALACVVAIYSIRFTSAMTPVVMGPPQPL